MRGYLPESWGCIRCVFLSGRAAPVCSCRKVSVVGIQGRRPVRIPMTAVRGGGFSPAGHTRHLSVVCSHAIGRAAFGRKGRRTRFGSVCPIPPLPKLKGKCSKFYFFIAEEINLCFLLNVVLNNDNSCRNESF